MEYIDFGKTGLKVSRFGMGCMRLPVAQQPDGSLRPDEDAAVRLIRHAVDLGVNYFDTAYPYMGREGERIVGKALKDGYRERVNLVTKLPGWFVKTYADFERLLDEQLGKLQTDYLDFYLIHTANKVLWADLYRDGVLEFFEEAKRKGKIRFAGFSFHDSPPVFKEIVDAYDWDMCQIQLNYLDTEFQAGLEGMRYAGAKGIPVVVMEPLRGGSLAKVAHPEVAEIFEGSGFGYSPVEWAFKFLYNFPEVAVILSGVTTIEQLEDNVRIFANSAPNSLSQAELDVIARAKTFFDSKIRVRCTGCRYCMPCPQKVFISGIFDIYNGAYVQNDMPGHAKWYDEFVQHGESQGKMDATFCVECGKCEKACPQQIPIIHKLKEAHVALRAGLNG